VTVGFALGPATASAAAQYPGVDFIGVDQFQEEELDNVTGLIFYEDRAGFLAGALAGLLTESDTIAAVLGTDLVPPVMAFGEGFANGASYVNPDVRILTTYHPGGLDVAFTDPEWGAVTAAQSIDSGADVIFGAGGKTGNGALIETAGRQGLYCIGVDTDQWLTVPEARPCLVSSAMKMLTPGVHELVVLSVRDRFPSGNYIGEIALASFHDFNAEVPDEILERLLEIERALSDGSLATGYEP
jgi:basic membrane protein A